MTRVDRIERTDRPLELAPATIDAIARRVVELLDSHTTGATQPAALIDAAELARRTGTSRTWIYQHAHELGAVRLGSGPNARLRFDAAAVSLALSADGPGPSPPVSQPRRPRRFAAPDAPLLPIKGSRAMMSMLCCVRRRSH